ncbi:MAG: tripartite tricarboxylate transporter permease [Candidimonas sp.]|nr:MAG: tripartite tricarboxylate transporter permease [Candidimonas sp.]
MEASLSGLLYGFGVALEPHNLVWCVFGVVTGNLIGVLPGLGSVAAMAILLPLTYVMHPVAAILMLAGIFYGSMYGGAIGAILLNLPVHPQHAVTCLDGYPLTRKGRGGAALGIAMMASFFAASVGILTMVFASSLLVEAAFKFGPAELCSIMLLGLIAGSTMAGGSATKGIAMTLVGLVLGIVGTDPNTSTMRYTFNLLNLQDGVDLVALAMGLFGVSEFLLHINHMAATDSSLKVAVGDMLPSKEELKKSFFPMLRGTFVGTLFGAMPGTGPTITTFVAYALEKKISKTPGRFGSGAIEGVASPEAAGHSKSQVDFIPTMSLGIPGDPMMALILGALLIQGIQPWPQLITAHPDVFWGLIASFWIGNLLLIVLNVPLIGVWVKLLRVPYRYLVPSAMFFIAVGCFSTQNSLFEVGEVLVFGIVGAILTYLDFSVAPILLGYVLGPIMEENFRRALLLSHGHLAVFVEHPISAGFLVACALLLAVQLFAYILRNRRARKQPYRESVPLEG